MMSRKLLAPHLMFAFFVLSCSISNFFPTPTPTVTATASPTNTFTVTETPSITPSKIPTPTPTPIQDVEAFKEIATGRILAYLQNEFAVLDIQKVEWQGETLLVDIRTSYGSDVFNIEAAYYLSIGIADILLNEFGVDNIALIADSTNFSLTYRAISIHGDMPHGAEMDRALLELLANEEISIEDWFERANVRLLE